MVEIHVPGVLASNCMRYLGLLLKQAVLLAAFMILCELQQQAKPVTNTALWEAAVQGDSSLDIHAQAALRRIVVCLEAVGAP